MNDQQIFALIAATPNIRAVQIADAFDEAKCDVEASLRCMIEEGDVVASTGKLVLGGDVLEYNLTDQFLGNHENTALLAKARRSDAPKFSDQTGLENIGRTKPEMALAYLRKFHRATSVELRDVMGLNGKQYPQAYLTASIKNGEIVKTARGWELGHIKPLDSVIKHGNLILATCDAEPMPHEYLQAVQQLDKPAEAAIQASPAPALRCAIWSDGMVELQRDGRLKAQLTRSEADFIVDFILGQRQTQ